MHTLFEALNHRKSYLTIGIDSCIRLKSVVIGPHEVVVENAMLLLQCEEVLLSCGSLDEILANATFTSLLIDDHHIAVIHSEVGARLLLDSTGQLAHVREGTLLV